jgi:LuxR family transcriptional regulator of csgAB operon
MAAVLEQTRDAQVGRGVVIVGQRSVQNGLVASMIDERLGCGCEVQMIGGKSESIPGGAIALLDVDGMSTRDIAGHADSLLASGSYRSIALMNADEGSVGRLACSPGVRGVFFRDTSQEQLLKGLRAMMGGEYWLPRSVLAAHFENTRAATATASNRVELTVKETETLKLLVGGHSNIAIARRLGVSPHTVKTHLYNLFRKIGARNRVQAVKWAMKNLGRGFE